MNKLLKQWLQILLFLRMLRKGQISLRKLLNMLSNSLHYLRRTLRPNSYPSVIMLNVTNKCNLFCGVCRRSRTELTEISKNPDARIPLGTMPYAVFRKAIEESHRHVMLAIPYVTGEPLLNPDIYKMLRFARERKVATLLSTNGGPLTAENGRKLINAGLNYIKITISGYSQEVYGVFHRGGNIVRILDNTRNLARLAQDLSSDMIINVDYIVFAHNEHEVAKVREFCREHGVYFTTRIGYVFEEKVSAVKAKIDLPPSDKLCDWLWKVTVVDWDGHIIPCCFYGYKANPVQLGSEHAGNLHDVWNGKKYAGYRKVHIDKGRGAFDICAQCFMEGVKFQC